MSSGLIRGHVGGRVWRDDELVMVAPGFAVPRVALDAYMARRATWLLRRQRRRERWRRLAAARAVRLVHGR